MWSERKVKILRTFFATKQAKNPPFSCENGGFLVRVAGFEPTASWTRTMRATNCATPGWLYHYSVSKAFCQVEDFLWHLFPSKANIGLSTEAGAYLKLSHEMESLHQLDGTVSPLDIGVHHGGAPQTASDQVCPDLISTHGRVIFLNDSPLQQ